MDGSHPRLGHPPVPPGWWPKRFSAEAALELRTATVSARVLSATQDIGTRAAIPYFAQTVADKLGLPLNKIEVVLGDSSLPAGPLSGGSMAASSVIPAVAQACERATNVSIDDSVRRTPQSKYFDCEVKDLTWTNGRVHKKTEAPSDGVPFPEMLKLANYKIVTGKGHSPATARGKGKNFDALLWCALCRSHLARRNCPSANQPGDNGDRRRQNHQSKNSPQPDRRRCRHGHRHGNV